MNITTDMYRKIKYAEDLVEEQGFKLILTVDGYFALENLHEDYVENNRTIISDNLCDVILYINGWIARKTHDKLINQS